MIPLALFGQPLAHSHSPRIHARFAAHFGRAVDYRLIECDATALPGELRAFFAAGGRGANLTLPLKRAVIDALDALDDSAAAAGAVNTVRVDADGRLFGHNTDGAGFIADWRAHAPPRGEEWHVLLLGAGGAARGVLPALLQQNPDTVLVVNRTAAGATELAACDDRVHALPAEYLPLLADPVDLVINATSMGHAGAHPTLPPAVIGEYTLCMDLSYGAAAQPFLQHCRDLGARRGVDGLGMLVRQAAAAWDVWFAETPDESLIDAVLRELRGELQK